MIKHSYLTPAMHRALETAGERGGLILIHPRTAPQTKNKLRELGLLKPSPRLSLTERGIEVRADLIKPENKA